MLPRTTRIAIISLYALENNGVRHIAASLRHAGFHVTEIYFKDWTNNHFPWPREREMELLLEQLRHRRIHVVGISVRASAFHRIASTITRRIRLELSLPVLWGGMHPTFLPERCIRQADYIAMGEVDRQVVEFFDRMDRGQDLSTCKSFWVKTAEGIHRNDLAPLVDDLDSLPFRDYHSHSDKLTIQGTRVRKGDPFIHNSEFTMLASRGCPYWKCTYCSNTVTRSLYDGLGRPFRVLSVENIVREVEYARTQTRAIRFVRFDDEVFPTDESWVEEFREKWPSRVGLPFEVLVDPRMVREKPLRMLKEAGLRALCMGIQATERVNRELFNRDIPNTRIVECQRIFRRLGIRSNLQIIWDDPCSTDHDKDELFRLLMSLERPFEVFLFGLTIYPSTHLARRLLREGRITPRHVEGESTHAFEQFRVDLDYPRPAADRRWLALVVLSNKSFIPRWLLWRLYLNQRYRKDPAPLLRLAKAANLLHLAQTGGEMALRGEMSFLLLKRWLNLRSLVTM